MGIERRKVNWILEADIQAFFDSIDHAWTLRFLEHRIADRRILRLSRNWLKAGVIEDGRRVAAEKGAPQGEVISPLLANIYLHYAHDLWVHRWRQRHARGHAIPVRYADDSVPRRRTGGRKSSVQPCCTRDEGRPLEVGVQAQASNHRLLLRLRGVVVSETGKGRG